MTESDKTPTQLTADQRKQAEAELLQHLESARTVMQKLGWKKTDLTIAMKFEFFEQPK